MPVVSTAELQAAWPLHLFLGTELETAASVILDGLVGDVEAYLGRPLETVTVTETLRYDRGFQGVVLSKTPVIAVSSLSVYGTTIDPLAYRVTPWGIDEWWPYGCPTITYTAGLLEAKPESAAPIKRLILQAAKRAMAKLLADQVGLTRVSVDGGTSLEWIGSDTEDTFTEGELARVVRWKRRVGTRTGAPCTPPLIW